MLDYLLFLSLSHTNIYIYMSVYLYIYGWGADEAWIAETAVHLNNMSRYTSPWFIICSIISVSYYAYIFRSFAYTDDITRGSIFIFLFFLKLGEKNQMFKVLGCYSAIKAAQPTAKSNFITNELSLFSQKDRNPICFFISYMGGWFGFIYIYIYIMG